MLDITTRFTCENGPSAGYQTVEEAIQQERAHRRIIALRNLGVLKSNNQMSTNHLTEADLVNKYDEIRAALDASDDQFVRDNMKFLKKHLPEFLESE